MKNISLYLRVIVLLSGLAFIHACKEYDEEPFARLPVVLTGSPGLILSNMIVMSGEVSDDFGLTVKARGFCWSKINQDPTIDDDTLVVGQGEGGFCDTIMGLKGNTQYFIRTFATTKKGTGYGAALTIKTAFH
jgi:hypothetical protein